MNRSHFVSFSSRCMERSKAVNSVWMVDGRCRPSPTLPHSNQLSLLSQQRHHVGGRNWIMFFAGPWPSGSLIAIRVPPTDGQSGLGGLGRLFDYGKYPKREGFALCHFSRGPLVTGDRRRWGRGGLGRGTFSGKKVTQNEQRHFDVSWGAGKKGRLQNRTK